LGSAFREEVIFGHFSRSTAALSDFIFCLETWGKLSLVLFPLASFPLKAYCQNQSGVLILLKTLERQITRASAGNRQRISAELDGTSDQRVKYPRRHRLLNQTNYLYHRQKISLNPEVSQPSRSASACSE
jgi:hypothetical protein